MGTREMHSVRTELLCLYTDFVYTGFVPYQIPPLFCRTRAMCYSVCCNTKFCVPIIFLCNTLMNVLQYLCFIVVYYFMEYLFLNISQF